MFRLILSIVLLAVAIASPVSQETRPSFVSSRIAGIAAYETTIEKYPYQVGLLNHNNEYGTGAIISHYWVITAGHLVRSEVTRPRLIRAGSTKKSRGSFHEIDYIVLHENYSSGGDDYMRQNDLALIRVSNPFLFDSTRQPIQLAESTVKPRTACYTSGWGRRWGGSMSEVLMAANVVVDSKESCNQTFKDIGFYQGVPEKYVCTYGMFGASAYYGDEGSPLWCGGKLAGVASGFHTINSEVYYSDISEFRNWIRYHTGV